MFYQLLQARLVEVTGTSLQESSSVPPTPEQIRLLQDSFQTVARQGEAFVARFYENLFSVYPATRLLFEEARLVKTQKQVLNALVVTINGLREPDKLEPFLKQLGARHARYGILPSYLPIFEPITILTLKEFLGANWNGELEQAWRMALRVVIQIMRQGVGQLHLQGDVEDRSRRVAARGTRTRQARAPWRQQFAQAYRNTPQWLVTILIFAAVITLFVTAEKYPFISNLLDKAESIAILIAVLF